MSTLHQGPIRHGDTHHRRRRHTNGSSAGASSVPPRQRVRPETGARFRQSAQGFTCPNTGGEGGTAAPSAAEITEQILRILESSEIQRLDFSFTSVDGQTTVRVYPAAYAAVAQGIRTNRIIVSPNIHAGTVARYSPQTNNLTISACGFANADDKALVLHECTHAVQDYHRVVLPVVDSEAAAYIAQVAYYRLLTNTNTRAYPWVNDSQRTKVFFWSFVLAGDLLGIPNVPRPGQGRQRWEQTGEIMYNRRGHVVGPPRYDRALALNNLRDEIQSWSLYGGQGRPLTYEYDGY